MSFQSTPPVWAETCEIGCKFSPRRNFNPLRPCGRRLMFLSIFLFAYTISIHSARVGGDADGRGNRGGGDISIHSARVGGDAKNKYNAKAYENFNPLRPCGRRL